MISDIHYQQRPLFPGKQAKEKGMEQGNKNSDEDFKRVATKAIHTYAKSKEFVTANDVWDTLDTLGITTHDNRALGSLFLKAAKNKWIEKTNQTIQSNRETRHAGDVRVWRSLLYNPAMPT
tara:strand:+ start:2721 stop:3083 length:363 start_codon:yes stop_codon:yes gene_type:complete